MITTAVLRLATASSEQQHAFSLQPFVLFTALTISATTTTYGRADDFSKGTFIKNKGFDGSRGAITYDGNVKVTVTQDDQEVVKLDYKVTKNEVEFSNEMGPIADKDAKPGTYMWKLNGKKLTFT